MGAVVFLGVVCLLLVLVAGVRQRRAGRNPEHTLDRVRSNDDKRDGPVVG